MGKRIKIGIIYSYDENWIGGTYYYQYLIQSLNLLPIDQKPHIVILGINKSGFESIKAFNYPFISYYFLVKNPTFIRNLKNRLFNIFRAFKSQYKKEINLNIDVLFHPSELIIANTINNHLYWIPDFQEHYFPNLFSEEHLNYRIEMQKKILSKNDHILFSSEDALKDFNKIYPEAETNGYVVNFAVFHPAYNTIKLQDLEKKYELPNGYAYFFCPNQFWKHKNHMIVLKAVKYLKTTYNIEPLVLFSGKEYDLRNPTYFKDLKTYVDENGLNNNIKFLGFIDRKDQLCLMSNAVAVIQPSLFEGWSSVVEDAKAMNQNVIVSSLDVHKEQLEDKGYYFNPEDVSKLVEHMLLFTENKIAKPQFNYSENQNTFGSKFMDVIKTMN